MAFGRFGVGSFDDDQPIGFWMDDQTDQTAKRDAFAAAGSDRWNAATRSGENLDASRPTDVVALGAPRSPIATPDGSAVAQGDSGDPSAGDGPGNQSDTAPGAPGQPSVRYVMARPGDNITRLAGSSDPGVVGAFARLNGMDGRSSTVYAGRVYQIPTDDDAAAPEDATLGSQLLQHDNARVAALRATRAANDQSQPRFDPGQDVRTGQPVGATLLPALPSQSQPWWESKPAKIAAGTLAYAGGAAAGAPMAVVHAVGDAMDAGHFGLRLAGAFGPQAQAQADREAANVARGAVDYTRAAIADPSKVVSDVRDVAGRAVHDMSPLNADMSGSTWEVAKHQFDHGEKFGEAATNVAGMFAGGELVQGVRAANAFEATRPARIAKLVEQGRSPKLAEYLAQRYPGGGHHSLIPQRLAKRLDLPKWVVDNPINLSTPRGMSRDDFYRHHYQVDPKAGGFRLPADLNGGKGWRPKELGLTKYSLPVRIWKGMPVPLKDTMAAVTFADAPTLYGDLEQQQ